VSRLLHDLATISDCFGEHSDAVALHLEAIAIREKVKEFAATLISQTLGEGHPQLAVSYEVLGITYKLMGEYRKAATAMQTALRINEGTVQTGRVV
jgi:tetratricopeptide (TPR) repeat protein